MRSLRPLRYERCVHVCRRDMLLGVVATLLRALLLEITRGAIAVTRMKMAMMLLRYVDDDTRCFTRAQASDERGGEPALPRDIRI